MLDLNLNEVNDPKGSQIGHRELNRFSSCQLFKGEATLGALTRKIDLWSFLAPDIHEAPGTTTPQSITLEYDAFMVNAQT